MERRCILPGPAPHVFLVIDVQGRPILLSQIPNVHAPDRDDAFLPSSVARPDMRVQGIQIARRTDRVVFGQDVRVPGPSRVNSTHIRSLGVSPIMFSPLPRAMRAASAKLARPACTPPGFSSPLGTAEHRSCTSWYAPATLSKQNTSGPGSPSRSA